MRLYRGLTKRYSPAEVRSRQQETHNGTDFTDCPFTALSHATGRHGVVLVVDVPADAGLAVTEELWLTGPEKRFVIWGTFDPWLTVVIPAKELRAEVRRKGIAGLSRADKARVLVQAIERRLDAPEGERSPSVGPQRAERPTLEGRCQACGGALEDGATTHLVGRGTFCDPCCSALLAAEHGVRFDNARLDPVTVRDREGAPHTFTIRSRLVPGVGHVMEAIEDGAESLGHSFKVLGPEECDALALFRELYARMRAGIEAQQLSRTRLGLQIAGGDGFSGRIERAPDADEPLVVVDGKPRTWTELGQLLLTYEGWLVDFGIRSSFDEVLLVPVAGEGGSRDH